MNRIGNIDLSGYVVAVLVCFVMGWLVPSAVGQEQGQYEYRFLATSTSASMQKELDAAAAAGFRFAAVASKKAFVDILVIMQKNSGGGTQGPRYQYKVLATTKVSTMRKELLQEGKAGFALVGMTAITEHVAILERRVD